MHLLTIVTIGFLILELSNVITLYFFPGSRYANGVGVFNAWEKSKQDPEVHAFVKYLVNWVAGTKLIFIMLLIVILYAGDEQVLRLSSVALVLSILSFFWRLFPLARQMDRDRQLTPAGYSTALGVMIFGMIAVFFIAFLVAA